MATLSGLTTRVQTALMDTGARVWDSATVTEGIRLALGEYSLAGAAAATIDGLDGAASSNLPELHDGVIVWGAAAYAALSRTVDRADTYQLQGESAAALKTWGDQRLREFKGMLGFIFPAYLVALSGSGGGAGSEDPAKLAAEIALMGAQTTAITGQESRAAAAATQAAADRTAEAARLAGLRASTTTPWESWEYEEDD